MTTVVWHFNKKSPADTLVNSKNVPQMTVWGLFQKKAIPHVYSLVQMSVQNRLNCEIWLLKKVSRFSKKKCKQVWSRYDQHFLKCKINCRHGHTETPTHTLSQISLLRAISSSFLFLNVDFSFTLAN